MRIILYMAITIDGYIANENDDTGWISKKEWDSYSLAVRTAGNVVIGHRTYNIITKQPEFREFKDVRVVVVSHQNFKTLSSNHIVVKSPGEAIELLKNFKEIVIAGGGNLNSAFLSEDLVDEIYLDIEPIILGKGIKLFADTNFETKLELMEIKNFSKSEIQLHYLVKKRKV